MIKLLLDPDKTPFGVGIMQFDRSLVMVPFCHPDVAVYCTIYDVEVLGTMTQIVEVRCTKCDKEIWKDDESRSSFDTAILFNPEIHTIEWLSDWIQRWTGFFSDEFKVVIENE